MDKITNDYYTNNAKLFVNDTIHLTQAMQHLYSRFVRYLNGNKILDLGCGSGRDSLYFMSQCYDVTSLDCNETMLSFAAANGVQNIVCQSIEDYDTEQNYDGIWACASLLHIPKEKLPNILIKYADMLNDGGVMYCSFKYGKRDGIHCGRYFADQTVQSFDQILNAIDKFNVLEVFISEDVRSNTKRKWLNAFLRKK